MANKMTKAQMFNMIKAVAEVKANPDMVAFIDHELELLANKRSTKSPTKTQKANMALLPSVAEVVKALKKASASEILAEGVKMGVFEEGISNQKVSALLKLCCESGLATKVTEKGKTSFLPKAEEVAEG